MLNKNRKTLIINNFAPPVVVGTSSVLYNSLIYFPDNTYCILMSDYRKMSFLLVDEETRLDCRYYMSKVPVYSGNNSRLKSLSTLLEFLFIPFIVAKGIHAHFTEKFHQILAVSNDGNFFIAAYLLHKVIRIPLYIYMLDLYEEGRRYRVQKLMARFFEKNIFRSAKEVFVMSENMKSHYLDKYGRRCRFIPHPVLLQQYGDNNTEGLDKKERFKIVYTGDLTAAQKPCIIDLISAVNDLEEVELNLYIPKLFKNLKQLENPGLNVKVWSVSRSEIPRIQQTADILFLPLSFDSTYPDVIRTASPNKMPEYLAAGRPILVYAPDYAYISEYALQNNFALVVNEAGRESLKKAIIKLLKDKPFREQITGNASALAHRHNAEAVSKALQQYLI